AVTLRVAIETRHSLADNAKLRRVFELYVLRDRLLRRVVRELSIACGAIARSIHNAVFSSTLIRSNFPTIGSLSDQHRTRLCAELAVLLKRVRDRSRAADHLNTEQRVFINVPGRRELGDDLGPIGVHLVGKNHRQRSLHTLAELKPVNCDHDVAVAPHVNERIRRINLRWRRLLCYQRGFIEIKRNQQSAGSSRGELNKTSPAQFWFHHAAPLICREALAIASRIRTYVAHRQRFPPIDSSMFVSVGFGVAFRSATALMICPLWQ